MEIKRSGSHIAIQEQLESKVLELGSPGTELEFAL